MSATSGPKRSRADKPGSVRFSEIKQELDRRPGFWAAVHEALNTIEFDENFVSETRSVEQQQRLKFIKDSIWGMMSFTPDEMALVDSPLIQRLRGIKQLGFTYLTYPSGEHSRFTHTLGVAHVTKRLLASVEELATRQPSFTAGGESYDVFSPRHDPELSRSLIHAALLHDVGHLAFSHASEAALKAYVHRLSFGVTPLRDLIDLFREKSVGSELSEIISILICLSPRFEKFYTKIVGKDSSASILRICSFISGTPHDYKFPGLANIISGAAVDADKIDYINRDALNCGIPVGVDVSRVFLNTSLVKLTSDHTRKLVERSLGDAPAIPPGVHFIVNSAGIDTYDEIATSKAILFHRIYLHQTTRNAEQVFAECIARMCRTGAEAGATPLNVLDLFCHNDEQMLLHLRTVPETRGLVKYFSARRLPKRAFVLFREVCEPFIKPSDIFSEGTESFSRRALPEKDAEVRRTSPWRVWNDLVPSDPLETPETLESFRERLREGAVELRCRLDQRFSRDSLLRGEPFVGFAPRFMLKTATEVLVREKNTIGRSVQWTKSEELTTADNLFRAIDYVYSDRLWAMYVQASCVREVFQRGATLSTVQVEDDPPADSDYEQVKIQIRPTIDLQLDEISSRVGFEYDELIEFMSRADACGFFGAAHRLAPLMREQVRTCDEVVKRYERFHGERGWIVTRRSTSAFVRQFPVGLRDEVIDLLLGGEMLSRVELTASIGSLLSKLAGPGESLLVCRFSPNSGNYVGMLIEQDLRNEMKQAGHSFARNPSEIDRLLEEDPERILVFLDDQFGTGAQASAQLYHWAGIPTSEWPLDLRGEQNIDFSTPGKLFLDHLRSRRTVILYAMGTQAGAARIAATALSPDVSFGHLRVQYGTEIESRAIKLSVQLREFLQDVGQSVLRHCRGENASDENCLRDALGYGNGCSLVVTQHNVPSHTITAIWCPGFYRDVPWFPLFLRRGYRKHLVIG